ncbi:Hypothetical predicted protein [Paramuricea clavata]|uniref:Uncharacterized protein n=1 Tax=Paramuricea clavata TaxID=317549 RepID=A0A6S7K8B5_PARCT|nr:Hypothetical predicted protein [Paramuricea clavata]
MTLRKASKNAYKSVGILTAYIHKCIVDIKDNQVYFDIVNNVEEACEGLANGKPIGQRIRDMISLQLCCGKKVNCLVSLSKVARNVCQLKPVATEKNDRFEPDDDMPPAELEYKEEEDKKGKPQLSPVFVEAIRSIANVKIHVERVIGCVRQKYTILGHGIAPIDYLKSDNGEPCLLDKIALVSCALVNCCKSVVSVE